MVDLPGRLPVVVDELGEPVGCESMTENLGIDIEWVVVGEGHGVGDAQCRSALRVTGVQ